MVNEKSLRESLLDAEPISAERQKRFQEELAEIVEPRLSRGYRLYYWAALLGLVAGLPSVISGALSDAEHRWMWVVFLVACAGFAGWILYILRRGAEPLRLMQGMSKGLTGISALVVGLLVAYGLQEPSLTSVLWTLAGLAVFILTSVINLWNRLLTAERTIREQILRVEYRVADQSRPLRA